MIAHQEATSNRAKTSSTPTCGLDQCVNAVFSSPGRARDRGYVVKGLSERFFVALRMTAS